MHEFHKERQHKNMTDHFVKRTFSENWKPFDYQFIRRHF